MRQSAQLKSAIISLLSLEKLVNNATMRYCFTNCINTVKKCGTIHEAIVKINELKQDSCQLYKWNVLTAYCTDIFTDIIDNFILVLNNQLSFTHETEVVHEESDTNECSALSHAKALKHESEKIPLIAKSEKPQNPFSERSETDDSPEKHPGGISESQFDSDELERATGRMCKYLLNTLYGKTIEDFDSMSCVEKTDMLCNLSGILDEITNDLNVDTEAGEYLDISPDGEIEIKPRNWKLSKQAEDCLFGRDKSPQEMLAELYGFTYADTDSIKVPDSERSETQESEEVCNKYE